MTDAGSHVTRRRLLGGLITVAGGSAAAGAGTMAYFSDAESSDDNAVEAGTLALAFEGPATFAFDAALAPTQTTTASVTLANAGTLAGSLAVDVDYAESDADGNDTDVGPAQVARNLTVETLTYGGTDLLDRVDGSPPTVHDLATEADGADGSTANDLVDLADPGAGGTTFAVELRLADVGDEFQRDGVSIDFAFHLDQREGR